MAGHCGAREQILLTELPISSLRILDRLTPDVASLTMLLLFQKQSLPCFPSLTVIQAARFIWGYRTYKMLFNAPRGELRNKFPNRYGIRNSIRLLKVTG